MANSGTTAASAVRAPASAPRHAAVVRVTHWITALCFVFLLLTGIEILISHPRFYWGEAGNINTPPLFKIPIPSSRATVPTGYGYVLPDQNGWSRALHFQAAWFAVFTGLVYLVFGAVTGHFRKNLFPSASGLSWRALWTEIGKHVRLERPSDTDYNVLQRLSYAFVIFILFPLMIWTGLAMSTAVVSAVPGVVTVFGGQQSARTIHFFVSIALVAFLLVHIAMIMLAGFTQRMQVMTSGRPASGKEQ